MRFVRLEFVGILAFFQGTRVARRLQRDWLGQGLKGLRVQDIMAPSTSMDDPFNPQALSLKPREHGQAQSALQAFRA